VKAFNRLSAWISKEGVSSRTRQPATTTDVSTLSQELEEISWEMLLDDIDRFAARFGEAANPARE
jgi:hypothetical protein